MSSLPSKLNTTYISGPLAEKLSYISEYPVTSVVAPIGYGKTRAIGWWAERRLRKHPDTLLLRQVIITPSLVDFWHGFCRNLRAWPELEKEMQALGFPSEPQSRQLMHELLSDALQSRDRDIFYIIDDLHFLPDPALTELILFLSDRLPPRVHIILMSRNVIFDRAAQMKLGPKLWTLDVDDLRLSRQGVAEYALRGGQHISQLDSDMLSKSTEGWFSMVYLHLRAFAQTGRWPENTSNIYPLIDEVLFAPLPPRQRDFLVLLGVPDDFTAEQARYLWSDGDAAELLRQLTGQNAFITCVDGVYRYHNMLRSCAREKFRLLPETEKRDYLSNLGSWYAGIGEYYLAELCFERAGAWDELLCAFFSDQARSITGENKDKMLSWYSDCPEDIWKKHPDAMLVMLRKLFSFGCVKEMYRMRDMLYDTIEHDDAMPEAEKNNYFGEIELNMSFLAFNDISAMSAYHRRACSLMTRPVVGMTGGNWTFGSPSVLAQYHRTAGGLDHENAEMRECMPYFYRVTEGHGSGAEYTMQAETDFYRGDLVDAEINYRLAVESARGCGQFSIWLAADFLKAQMLVFEGHMAEAELILKKQEELLRRERRYALLYTVDLCRAWIYGLLGQSGDQPLWLRDPSVPSPMMRPAAPMVEMTRSQILLARREWTAAAAREHTVLSSCAGYKGMLLCSIWAELQLCAAYEHLGKRETALRHLSAAVDDAAPDMLVMPFVFFWDQLRDIIPLLPDDPAQKAFIERISGLAQQYMPARSGMLRSFFPQSRLDSYGLTDRELEIARMTIQRKTRKEIGLALGITEKTVSNRLTTVYEKLGLDGSSSSRRQALMELFEKNNV